MRSDPETKKPVTQLKLDDITKSEAVRSLGNRDLVVYALYQLGGGEHKIDMEDVALECFRIAPERFSWKKHPEFPSIKPAEDSLYDASRPKNGSLVRGRARDGWWMLTPAGVDHAKALLPRLTQRAIGELRSSSDRQEMQKYFRELEAHPAFRKYTADGSCDAVKPYEFTEFLKCTLDSG